MKTFLNKQITKNYLHLLIINMFFIKKLVNNLFKNNHIIILWNILQVIGCRHHQSTKDYLKGRAYIKSSSKITLGLIIG